jgi:hypothetical protein
MFMDRQQLDVHNKMIGFIAHCKRKTVVGSLFDAGQQSDARMSQGEQNDLARLGARPRPAQGGR